jgi:hypothetical protein
MRPPPVYKDSCGTPITEGANVAFNLSGNVVRGQVQRVTRGGTFFIDVTEGYYKPFHVSHVRNARSILVLREGEES